MNVLPIHKKEGLCSAVVNMRKNHGTTDGKSKVILAEMRFLPQLVGRIRRQVSVIVPAVGIEPVVVHVFEQLPVELIAAGLGYQGNPTPRYAAVFGGNAVRNHLEFGDVFHARRCLAYIVGAPLGHRDSVHEVVDTGGAAAIDGGVVVAVVAWL